MCDRIDCATPSVGVDDKSGDKAPMVVFLLHDGGLLRARKWARRVSIVVGISVCADCRAKLKTPLEAFGAEGLGRMADAVRQHIVGYGEIIDSELAWVGPESREYRLAQLSREN